MAQLIIDNATGDKSLFRFIGRVEFELEMMKRQAPLEFVLYPTPNDKAVFVDDPMWIDPHLGFRGQKYAGLTDYNITVHGILDLKYLGGETDYYFIIDGDGREWGVKKIASPEAFNKASNADEFWLIPSKEYLGREVVGLTSSGQEIHGGKLFQGPYYGAWYAKSGDEELGVEIIRIAIPDVHKKMQEIKDAKDLRNGK